MISDLFKKVIPFETVLLSDSPSRENQLVEAMCKKSEDMANQVTLGEVKEQTPEQQQTINQFMKYPR